jgi:hypothetical protein
VKKEVVAATAAAVVTGAHSLAVVETTVGNSPHKNFKKALPKEGFFYFTTFMVFYFLYKFIQLKTAL